MRTPDHKTALSDEKNMQPSTTNSELVATSMNKTAWIKPTLELIPFQQTSAGIPQILPDGISTLGS